MICSHQLQSVAFRRGNLTCGSGSGRVETHGSVRVEFESTRVVHTAQTRRKAYDPIEQHGFKSPRGIGRDWPTPWPSRSMGKHAWPPSISNRGRRGGRLVRIRCAAPTRGAPFTSASSLGAARHAGTRRGYAMISFTTCPATSVNRKFRPLYRYVSLVCSSPIKCKTVACRSFTCTLFSTA